MRTNHIFLAAISAVFMTFGLTGCSNPDVEVRKGLEIKLRPATILANFTPYNSSNLEQYSDDDATSHLRITCLLYDETGRLAYREETLLDDYNEDVSFTAMVGNGSYKLIALASNIIGTLYSPTVEAYSITGTEYLSQLQIQQNEVSTNNRADSFYSTWSILGYATRTIGDSEKDLVISLESATSLVYLQWKSIHAHDNDGSGIDEYYIIYHLNDIMRFSDSGTPEYSSSLSATSNNGCSVEPADFSSSTNNIYEMCNFFPGRINIFARTFIGNERGGDYSEQTFSLSSGHQYLFSLDCSSIKLTASESVLGAKSASIEFDEADALRHHIVPSTNIP